VLVTGVRVRLCSFSGRHTWRSFLCLRCTILLADTSDASLRRARCKKLKWRLLSRSSRCTTERAGNVRGIRISLLRARLAKVVEGLQGRTEPLRMERPLPDPAAGNRRPVLRLAERLPHLGLVLRAVAWVPLRGEWRRPVHIRTMVLLAPHDLQVEQHRNPSRCPTWPLTRRLPRPI
jgi:hypothetical protein